MNRRGFLTGIIAACAAPAIVRSGLIMPIKPALVTDPWEVWEYHGTPDHAADALRYMFEAQALGTSIFMRNGPTLKRIELRDYYVGLDLARDA